ncbi:unnamed protein product [Gadus morhua 'NCC']
MPMAMRPHKDFLRAEEAPSCFTLGASARQDQQPFDMAPPGCKATFFLTRRRGGGGGDVGILLWYSRLE